MASSGGFTSNIKKAPHLLLRQCHTEGDTVDKSRSTLSLFSVADRSLVSTITPPYPSTCIGSGLGWLILTDHNESGISLFNPSTTVNLPLPALKTLNQPDRFIYRSTLIQNPRTCALTVFLFLDDFSVFFAEPNGSDSWTPLDASSKYLDVATKGDEIVAVRTDGTVCGWDSGPGFPSEIPISDTQDTRDLFEWAQLRKRDPLEFYSRDISFFLVRSAAGDGGDLWRVRKEWKADALSVVKVHRVTSFLEEVEDLGGKALFVGGGSTGFAVDPEAFDRVMGDCVYFAEQCTNYMLSRPAIAVYSLKDGRVLEMLPRTRDFSPEIWPQPAWFMPDLD